MMNDNCCGNFICEAGEEVCSSDCGPFVLGTGRSNVNNYLMTFMFDVEAVNVRILNAHFFIISCTTKIVSNECFLARMYSYQAWPWIFFPPLQMAQSTQLMEGLLTMTITQPQILGHRSLLGEIIRLLAVSPFILWLWHVLTHFMFSWLSVFSNGCPRWILAQRTMNFNETVAVSAGSIQR